MIYQTAIAAPILQLQRNCDVEQYLNPSGSKATKSKCYDHAVCFLITLYYVSAHVHINKSAKSAGVYLTLAEVIG